MTNFSNFLIIKDIFIIMIIFKETTIIESFLKVKQCEWMKTLALLLTQPLFRCFLNNTRKNVFLIIFWMLIKKMRLG